MNSLFNFTSSFPAIVPTRFTNHRLRTYADNNFTLFDDIFDGFFDNKVPSYPPYNATMLDENNYVIEVALAGFTKDDFEVELKNDSLLICSLTQEEKPEEELTSEGVEKCDSEGKPATYTYPYALHKGIAKRSFSLSFKIPKSAQVSDPTFKDGLLTINIAKILDKEDKPKILKVK